MSDELYQVPAVNMARLKAEIAKLNKRATRNKRPPVELVVHRSYTQAELDSLGFEYQRKYLEVSVSGESPQLSGWSLVAVLEPRKNDENLVREVPGEKCPAQYRHTDNHCDHCQTSARRKKLYVLRHTKGDHKQVGSKCLGDFLDCDSPQQIVSDAERLFTFSGFCGAAQNADWGFGDESPVVEISRYTSIVATVIRRYGWVPKSKATMDNRATALIAWDMALYPDVMEEVIQKDDLQVTPADVTKAESAVNWAKAIEPDDAPNTFIHNLGVACRDDYVDSSTSGTVAAVFVAYDRHVQDTQSLPQNSKHIGEVKERRVFANLTIVSKNQFESDYGWSTYVRFEDADGNLIFWKASGRPEWIPDVGAKISIKATVIKHDEYRGVKETRVNRAVEEEEGQT